MHWQIPAGLAAWHLTLLLLSLDLWQEIGGPKGLPDEVKNKMAAGIEGIVHDLEFKKNLESLGMDVEYLGSKESIDKWISDKARLTKIVKETGLAERIASQKN